MSRLALISDIHGNVVALDVVLADLAHRDEIDGIVCLGDVAAGGPQPGEVIARLRALECQVVRGNADRWLLEGLPPGRGEETRRLGAIVDWARGTLAADDLDYLAALPSMLNVAAGGVSLVCFHGSPRSDVEPLLATTSDRELDEALTGTPAAGVFAGGHTHQQLLRRHGERLLINPGSVGLPLGSLAGTDQPLPAWAEYALVESDGSKVEIAFRRIPIDAATLAAQTEAMPHAGAWARDLHRRIERWNARAAA